MYVYVYTFDEQRILFCSNYHILHHDMLQFFAVFFLIRARCHRLFDRNRRSEFYGMACKLNEQAQKDSQTEKWLRIASISVYFFFVGDFFPACSMDKAELDFIIPRQYSSRNVFDGTGFCFLRIVSENVTRYFYLWRVKKSGEKTSNFRLSLCFGRFVARIISLFHSLRSGMFVCSSSHRVLRCVYDVVLIKSQKNQITFLRVTSVH